MSRASICLLLAHATLVCSIGGCLEKTEDASRYQREIDAMPTGLGILDDNGTLVEITMDEKPDSKAFTRKFINIANTFHLFTRVNPTRSQLLWTNYPKIFARSYFDSERPTRFITHGWMNNGNSVACTLIRDGELITSGFFVPTAYLENSDCNVIVFDWRQSSFGSYISAANQIVRIALEVARMIDFLVDYGQLDPDTTTLVGHSLGAHVMGLAGYYSKHKIRNVVGLDPALPMFQFAGPDSSISKMDGQHVQIIHTNGGFLGYLGAAGHTDFYPNGGWKQPGCLPEDIVACACSHNRAIEYFAESITTTEPFYGWECDSFMNFLAGNCMDQAVPMGGAELANAHPGNYYLWTDSRSPFAT